MSWTNIDDRILSHPKMKKAVKLKGDAAWTMWSRGLVYTNAYDLDGRIPRDVIDELTTDRKPFEIAQVLVDVGLWELRSDRDYQVHDYADYNDSRAEREARRKAGRDRLKKHRDKKAGVEPATETKSDANDGGNAGETRFTPDSPTEQKRVTEKVIPSQAKPHQATPSREERAAPADPNTAAILATLEAIPALARVATLTTAEQLVAYVNGGGKKLDWVLAAVREYGAQEAIVAGSTDGPTIVPRLVSGLRGFVGKAREHRADDRALTVELTPEQIQAGQAKRGVQQGTGGPPQRVLREGEPHVG